MTTQTIVRNTRSLGTVGAIVGAVALSCLFAASVAHAESTMITVGIHVDARGLDLTQEEGAQKFYRRIKYAAWVACTRADRVALTPVDDPVQCTDQSLSRAIRSISVPALTRIYLETHTLQQASVAGISVPLAASAK